MNKSKEEKSVLLVEDEALLLEAMQEKFKTSGLNVMAAKNGEDGLKIAMLNHPDLIILDIVMPKMDGLAALKELRKDPWGKTVPVIVFTNINEAEKLAEAMESGITEYLIKAEISLNDIVYRAKKILGLN